MNRVKAGCLAALILSAAPFAVADAPAEATEAPSAAASLSVTERSNGLPEPVLLGALSFLALSAIVLRRRRLWAHG